MNALLSRWIETGVGADWAVGFLAKLTLLLAVAWLLHAALVRANPRWRVLVWRGSAASALIVLALTLAGPAISLAVLPPITESSSTSVGMGSPPLTGPRAVNPAVGSDHEPNLELTPDWPPMPGQLDDADLGAIARQQPATVPEKTRSGGATSADIAPPVQRPWTIAMYLWTVWGIGVLAGALLEAIAAARLGWLRHRAAPADVALVVQAATVAARLNWRKPFNVLVTSEVGSPCVLGVWPPTILLPFADGYSMWGDDLVAVLAHEIQHLKNADLPWNALLRGVTRVLWFHPLAWHVRTTHAAACDAVCDAEAATFMGDVAAYCRTLARLALRVAVPLPAAGLAMARASSARRRIEALNRRLYSSGLPRLGMLFAILAGLVGAGLLGTTSLSRAESDVGEKRPLSETQAETAKNSSNQTAASAPADSDSTSPAVAVAAPDTSDDDAAGGASSETHEHNSPLPAGVIARLGSGRFRQPGGAAGLTWSPDGRYLATTSSGIVAGIGSLRIWDASSGEVVHAWEMNEGFGSLDFSPNGKAFSAATWWRAIYLWDVTSGKLLSHLAGHDYNSPGPLMPSYARFLPDGKSLVYGGRGAVLQVFEIASGRTTLNVDLGGRLNTNPRDIVALAVSPNGQAVAVATRDAKIRLWNLADNMLGLELDAGNVQHTCKFTGDGANVVWLEASNRGNQRKDGIYAADVATGSQRLLLANNPLNDHNTFDLSPDGKTVAVGCWDRAVRFFDFESGQKNGAFTELGASISTVAYSPDGSRLAAGGASGVIQLWDIKSGKELLRIDDQHRHAVVAGALIDGGRVALTGSKDGTVRRWDVKTGKLIAKVVEVAAGGPVEIDDVAISPDGRLAAFSHHTSVDLVDVATGQRQMLKGFGDKRNELPFLKPYTGPMCFSADGHTLAALSREGTGGKPQVSIVRVWDTSNGTRRSETRIETRQFTLPALALSADGTRFVVLGTKYRPEDNDPRGRDRDFETRLFDAATGEMVREYHGEQLFHAGRSFVCDRLQRHDQFLGRSQRRKVVFRPWES